MTLGRLAMLVATMPSWLDLVINRDKLDLSPSGGSNVRQTPLRTPAELVKALEEGVAAARKALAGTSEEHLLKPWRLLVSGRVVSEQPRYIVVRDTFMHWAHHRGQLTPAAQEPACSGDLQAVGRRRDVCLSALSSDVQVVVAAERAPNRSISRARLVTGPVLYSFPCWAWQTWHHLWPAGARLSQPSHHRRTGVA